jgi:pyridoxamine 5'-phosphate oxidase
LRKDWQEEAIDPALLEADPVEEFAKWYERAQTSTDMLPNAMSLATATADGRPSVRVVLLKGFGAEGFEFYTNYDSPKAHEIEANPRVALAFHWKPLFRQVRIEGVAERVEDETSRAYWETRPRGSRIAAWASAQSEVVGDYATLERRVAELEQEYPGESIPLPPFWGGYRVKPDRFEFWLSRESRLHDRFRYDANGDGTWRIARLQP